MVIKGVRIDATEISKEEANCRKVILLVCLNQSVIDKDTPFFLTCKDGNVYRIDVLSDSNKYDNYMTDFFKVLSDGSFLKDPVERDRYILRFLPTTHPCMESDKETYMCLNDKVYKVVNIHD